MRYLMCGWCLDDWNSEFVFHNSQESLSNSAVSFDTLTVRCRPSTRSTFTVGSLPILFSARITQRTRIERGILKREGQTLNGN